MARDSGGQNPYVAATVAITLADQQLWDHDPIAASTGLTAALAELREQDDALLILETCWRALRAEADRIEMEGGRATGDRARWERKARRVRRGWQAAVCLGFVVLCLLQ